MNESFSRPLSTAVLLITFNRPEHTGRVFDQVKKLRPRKLYFFNDGPRENNTEDKVKCEQVRKLTLEIDWECNLKVNFSDKNLGCKYGPVTAISWLFSIEEEGIILEDDILPDLSFFHFCETILERFKKDQNILMISGRNELNKWRNKECDYFFTLGGCWGWATWKRAWDLFDPEIKDWNEETKAKMRLQYGMKSKSMLHELEFGCDAVKDKNFDAWDYQWLFTKLKYGTKDIMPAVNLIRYIGFDNQATHVKSGKDKLFVYSLDSFSRCCIETDIDYNYINRVYRKSSDTNFVKIVRKIKRTLKKYM